MSAIDRLQAKLTRVVVPAHPRATPSGDVTMVRTYTYNRHSLRQLGHERGWDVLESGVMRTIPGGAAQIHVVPSGRVRGVIRDDAGTELYSVESDNAPETFNRIDALVEVGRGVLTRPRRIHEPVTYRGSYVGTNRQPGALKKENRRADVIGLASTIVVVPPGVREGRPVEGYTYTRRGALHKLMSGALKKLKATGGFSLAHNGHEPETGFMVALPDNEETFTTAEITEETIAGYFERHVESLDDPDTFLGAWLDPESGKVFLDVSRNLSDVDEAKKLGKKWKQLAIYDLDNGKEIRLARERKRKLVFLPKDNAKAAYEELKKHLGG